MINKFTPQAYGRFFLTKLIAKGGMAEIFKAKSYGIGGFEKTFALKRILPQFSEDEKFLTMLSDEARLTVQLNHRNIVQVFDFGIMQDQYYLSMELVEGVTLKKLIEDCTAKQTPIPPAIASYIILQVAAGLEYAHTRKDSTGQPLNVIHRDVSPDNVLLSFSGDVKLSDFGIAKAASNMTQTQTGMIKGKVLYLSPECVAGKAIDKRSDIFALGLVFYEALMGSRYFDGTSQIEVLGKINNTRIDENNLSQSLPQPLRKILAKALAYSASDRYASVEEFATDLSNYIEQTKSHVSERQLRDFLTKFYSQQITKLQNELDPPIDATTKQQLMQYSEGKIMAKAEESPEILDKTILTTQLQTSDPKTAFIHTSKSIFWPLLFVSVILFIFSDFFKPLIALAPVILFAAGGIAGFVYLTKFKKYLTSNSPSRVLQSRTGEILVFSVLSIFIWGMITLLSFATPTKGVLAANIEPIAKLQAKILKIGTDIEEIKNTTNKIASDITDIKQAIEDLDKKGGEIISNPTSPQDYYHNARIYALEGRTQQAIDSYSEFINQVADYIDVHESFQILINNTAGIEKTRRIYAELLTKKPENAVLKLMNIVLMSDASAQFAEYESLLAKHPTMAPVYYFMIKQKISENISSSTLQQISSVSGHLKKFAELDAQGNFKQYYIDKKRIQEVLNDMARFETELKGHVERVNKPMNVTVQENANGTTTINMIPKEMGSKKVLYGIDTNENLIDTGISPWVKDPGTGQPLPNFFVIVPKLAPGNHIIYTQYQDKNGVLSPIQKTYHSSQEISVYWESHFLPLSDGLKEVDLTIKLNTTQDYTRFKYSIDNELLDQETNQLKFRVKIPGGNRTIHIQGHTADGKASEILKSNIWIPETSSGVQIVR